MMIPTLAIPAKPGFLAIRPLWLFQRLLQYNHKAKTILTTLPASEKPEKPVPFHFNHLARICYY